MSGMVLFACLLGLLISTSSNLVSLFLHIYVKSLFNLFICYIPSSGFGKTPSPTKTEREHNFDRDLIFTSSLQQLLDK